MLALMCKSRFAAFENVQPIQRGAHTRLLMGHRIRGAGFILCGRQTEPEPESDVQHLQKEASRIAAEAAKRYGKAPPPPPPALPTVPPPPPPSTAGGGVDPVPAEAAESKEGGLPKTGDDAGKAPTAAVKPEVAVKIENHTPATPPVSDRIVG